MIETVIVSEPINPGRLVERVVDPSVGGIASFVGTVRDSSGKRERGERVKRLEYEAYTPMAEGEMQKIAREAVERFGVVKVIVHHRVGVLQISEVAVCIAVGTPHRDAAFDACRYLIEELKKRVPIWKKEVFNDGAEWVDPRP
ncbi:MAG: molybdenum cofactor biosynthesis protein MoaE [Ignavibacteriae bacterium]|nr:molybdenum cofactor biosynthesis protein MoaE [Ignavibacteriota bacterium]MCB9215518.1 molybdenum cofactor biosynthesis protein MoaE [Ignavibacteria bacterium]